MDRPRVDILVTDKPLAAFAAPPAGCGAFIEFSGIVRGEENGVPIRALEYQAYQPMAEREIERLVRELLVPHPCALVRVHHRTGAIPVGDTAILLQVAAPHRGEVFSFAVAFMDRLKKDVPIWKVSAHPLHPA